MEEGSEMGFWEMLVVGNLHVCGTEAKELQLGVRIGE